MAQTIYPAFRYRDAKAAIKWLTNVLGFVEGAVYEGDDGTIAHAELSFEGAWIMLGSATGPDRRPGELGPAMTYISVDAVDELYERARAAGADIRMEPTDQEHGSRDFAVSDPEGNVWSFGTYRVAAGTE